MSFAERKQLLDGVCSSKFAAPAFLQEANDDFLSWAPLNNISGTGPTARQGPAVVLDAAHARTLIFGGCAPGKLHAGCSSELWAHHLGGRTPQLSSLPSHAALRSRRCGPRPAQPHRIGRTAHHSPSASRS